MNTNDTKPVTLDDVQDLKGIAYSINGSDAHLYARLIPKLNNMSVPYLLALAGMLAAWQDIDTAQDIARYARAVWDADQRPEAVAFMAELWASQKERQRDDEHDDFIMPL